MKRLFRSRLTLGLFINSTQDKYETAILRGATEVAQAGGANLICFTSGALRSYHGFEAQRNVLYDLVSAENVDGLIICGTLAHPVGMSEMAVFCQRYASLPLVSIALQLPGIPTVLADPFNGMFELVRHLLTAHNLKNLAFIRGPRGQNEAEARYQAFEQALIESGRVVDPELVAGGDFTYDSGVQAARVLLTRDHPFDAIVAANDSMALGAMDVLTNAGLRVPDDVAVTGFDDTDEGRYAHSPLTTVRQSAYEQGRQATALLLAKIRGFEAADQVLAPAAMVTRRSCGCSSFPLPEHTAWVTAGTDCLELLASNRAPFIEAMVQSMRHIPADQVRIWAEQWFNSLQAELISGQKGTFLDAVERTLRLGRREGLDVTAWHQAINAIQALFFPCTNLQVPEDNLAMLLDQARQYTGQLSERLQAQQQYQAENQALALREMSEALLTSFNLNNLLEVLTWELPRLGVRSLYLVLFENPQQPAKSSRMIYAYQGQQRIHLPDNGLVFPSTELLPEKIWENLLSHSLIIEALYSKEDRLGFILVDVDPGSVAICNALRGLLSGALQGVMLLEERNHVQNDLEALVLQVENTNRELQMLVRSMAHDLRTPLRSVVSFASILSSEYASHLDDQGRNYLERIKRGGTRMSTLLDDLSSFLSLGRQVIQRQGVDMDLLVQNAIAVLHEDTLGRDIVWQFHELPGCQADPHLMQDVWINLISNAIKYTRDQRPALIEIGVLDQPHGLVYFVRDNGIGFDMRYAENLFGVFQRLHRVGEFEGNGIGLAIVQRIIQNHGGQIWAESDTGRGASFYFTVGKE